jgi:hypothetical protein
MKEEKEEVYNVPMRQRKIDKLRVAPNKKYFYGFLSSKKGKFYICSSE